MSYKIYHNVFFAWNGPGPYLCVWCDKDVYAWWDTAGDVDNSTTLDIHHVDHDRGNSDHRNLAPMHHGCHMEYHRLVRPIVARGSVLPDEWRQRIADGNSKRLATQTNEQYYTWLKNTRDGISSIDRTPTTCPDCGDGPFQGTHGVSMHKRKSGCADGKISAKLARQREQEKIEALFCECGDGPFYSKRAVNTHLGWGKCSSGVATVPIDPVYCPDCGRGPFRTVRSISTHKGMKKCV